MHPPGLDIRHRRVEGLQVEGLPTQMHPHVADPAAGIQRIQQSPPALQATQTRLPGQSNAVKRGGNAVGEQLRLGIVQRQGSGETNAGAGLKLPLERIAMNIDDTRQHQQPGRIQGAAVRNNTGGTIFHNDQSILQRQIGNRQPAIPQQHATTFYVQIPHRVCFPGS